MKTKTIISKKLGAAILMLLLNVLSQRAFSQSWTQINSGTTKKINCIFFTSSTIGYLGGNDSLLMKTTNGGATWSQINFSGINFYPGGEHILNIQFLNDDIGFITVGPYSGSYGTSDGGLTWNVIGLPGNHCFNQGLFFFDENNGFIGGSGCFQGEIISSVTNSNWLTGLWNANVLSSPLNISNNYITDINFYDANFGLAVSKSGYVFRTTDGGLNWDSISSPFPLAELTSVLIINDTLAYIGYNSANTGFGLYISTDAGLTWNFDTNTATFFYPDFLCLHQSNNGFIYTGGNSQIAPGIIFESNALNSIWNLATVNQSINDFSSYNDSVVFAVGDSGYIVVNHPQAITGNIKMQSVNNDLTIYPNPTDNIIYLVNSSKSLNSDALISIFSTIGGQISTFPFTNSIDVSTLNPGIYFIEVSSNGKSIKKKFIKK